MQVSLPDDALGKSVRCPGCKLVFPAEKPVEKPAASALPSLELGEPADSPPTGITQSPPNIAAPAPVWPSEPPPLSRPDRAPNLRRQSAGAKSGASTVLLLVFGAVLLFGVFSVMCVGGLAWVLFRTGAAARANAEIERDRAAEQAMENAKAAEERFVEKQLPPWFEDRPPFEKRVPPFFDELPNQFNPQPKEPALPKTGKMPSLPAPLPIKPAPLDADTVTRTFPDTIRNVVRGGGGRFLILHLPKLRQLAVFDVNQAKVVKYLPVASDNVQIAAGMTKLVLVYPDTKIVQRWNLLTYERELTSTLPLGDGIAGVGMGYGSDGPLVIQTVREPVSGEDHFLDIQSMQLIDLRVQIVGHVHRGANAQMRGSADGRTFGIASGGDHPYLLTIQGDGVTIRGTEQGGAVPGPDGKTIFGMGVFSPELKRLGGSPVNNTFCVPALSGPFYLAIPSGAFHPGNPGDRKSRGIDLRLVGDNRPLLTMPEIENAARDVFGGNRAGLSTDQRYHFIPAAQLLVTIPETMDRLVLHRLNLDDALDKSGIDYLYVASVPRPYAVLGGNYSYPVAVKSKKGGLKYRVEAGPEGMTIDGKGTVTWKVPADFGERQADVILTIGDRAGQEIFHTFKLAVVKDLPPEVKPPAVVENPTPPKKDPEPEPDIKVPPPAAGALAIVPPKLESSPLTRNLPDRFDQLAVGGGGRFLLLNLPGQRKIALFDANEAKVVHYFPVGGDSVRFAAGLDKLVMIFPDTKVIQRWNLLTRERELTATLDTAPIANVLMGSASHGPVVIAGNAGNVLLDLHTLKPRGAPVQGNAGGRSLSEFARISADGTVIACWGDGSPSGLQIYHVTPTGLKSDYEHISPGHLIPSPDGKIIYTGRGMFTNETRPLGVNVNARDGIGPWCVPSLCGSYYLSVNLNDAPGKKEPRAVSVHVQGEERPLITLPDIPIPKDLNPWGREKFGNDQRLLFIPDAKMIVTVPETNDRLIVHRFDIEEAMDKAGVNYLYATSRAPGLAVRGKDYVYSIQTRSKKGDVRYKLESGPEGMRITKAGVIFWRVPADHPGGEVNAIVTIADASGQEIFHTFRVAVVAALPAEAADAPKK
jgi:hypothetical protein